MNLTLPHPTHAIVSYTQTNPQDNTKEHIERHFYAAPSGEVFEHIHKEWKQAHANLAANGPELKVGFRLDGTMSPNLADVLLANINGMLSDRGPDEPKIDSPSLSRNRLAAFSFEATMRRRAYRQDTKASFSPPVIGDKTSRPPPNPGLSKQALPSLSQSLKGPEFGR